MFMARKVFFVILSIVVLFDILAVLFYRLLDLPLTSAFFNNIVISNITTLVMYYVISKFISLKYLFYDPSGSKFQKSLEIFGVISAFLSVIFSFYGALDSKPWILVLGVFFLVIFFLVAILALGIAVYKKNRKRFFLYLIMDLILLGFFIVGIYISVAMKSNVGRVMWVVALIMWFLFIGVVSAIEFIGGVSDVVTRNEPPKSKKKKKFVIIALLILAFIFLQPGLIDNFREFSVVKDIAGKDITVALEICKAKSSFNRDPCIYLLSKGSKDRYNYTDPDFCLQIEGLDYRDKCYMELLQCEKISDEVAKKVCTKIPNE